LCTGNSMMDNCVQTDKIHFNYSYCATPMFYSGKLINTFYKSLLQLNTSF
jgi:hypothetical protein